MSCVCPHPQASLSNELKSEMKSISGMGFPSPRVARTLLKCDGDRTKVLNTYNNDIVKTLTLYLVYRYLTSSFLWECWKKKDTMEIVQRQHCWHAMRNQRRYVHSERLFFIILL